MAAATACGGSFPDRKRPSGDPEAVKRCNPCRLGAGCAGWSPSGGGSAGWGPVTALPALKGPPVAPQPPDICREKLVFTWQDAQGTPSARDSCTPPAGATELHSCSGNRDPTCAARRGPKMKQTEKDEGHENSEATGRSVPSIALGFPPWLRVCTGHRTWAAARDSTPNARAQQSWVPRHRPGNWPLQELFRKLSI